MLNRIPSKKKPKDYEMEREKKLQIDLTWRNNERTTEKINKQIHNSVGSIVNSESIWANKLKNNNISTNQQKQRAHKKLEVKKAPTVIEYARDVDQKKMHTQAYGQCISNNAKWTDNHG